MMMANGHARGYFEIPSSPAGVEFIDENGGGPGVLTLLSI
jgi:hypothetical protein